MSKIKEIVAKINKSIQANALQDARFASAQLDGIAITAARANASGAPDLLPFIINNDGEGKYLGPDDVYSLQLYHKTNAIAYQNNTSTQYGDGNSYMMRSAQMSMIVMANRVKLRLAPEEVEMLIISAMPTVLDKDLLAALGLQSCLITPTGSDFNSVTLFKREFQLQNQQLSLPPEMIMLEIKYKIECKFKMACINTLTC